MQLLDELPIEVPGDALFLDGDDILMPKNSATEKPEIILTGIYGWLVKSLGIQPWGQCFIAAVIVGSLLFAGTLIHIEFRLTEINTRVQDIPLKLSNSLLSQASTYAKARRYDDALRSVSTADLLVSQAKASDLRPKEQYFTDQINLVSAIDGENYGPLAQKLSELRISLASYRSTLTPAPKLPKKTEAPPPQLTGQLLARIYTMYAPVYTRANVSLMGDGLSTFQANFSDRDVLVPPSKRWEDNNETIDSLNIMGGSQTLDGLVWNNVTFINMHIRYGGGSAKLINVKFVNCTFDLPPDAQGNRIADYAALGKTSELNVG